MQVWTIELINLCILIYINFSKSTGKRPKTYKGSRDGFQKLNDRETYSDSDEENIEFDKYVSSSFYCKKHGKGES